MNCYGDALKILVEFKLARLEVKNLRAYAWTLLKIARFT